MARRLALAFVLALAGLLATALAELPAWAAGRAFHHVPALATITSNAVEVLGHGDDVARLCTPRWHYVFEGRAYEGSAVAQDRVRLWPDTRHVGELRRGDRLTVWIDPERPAQSALHEDRLLGNQPGQWLLGLALLAASLAAMVGAFVRPRRAGAAST